MKNPKKIAVIGAGSAGPAAALFLAAQGHELTLFEQLAEPLPIGAGVLLQPTGMSVLAELKLLDSFLDYGAKVSGLFAQTIGGKTILDLHYADLGEGTFGLGIHRGVIWKILFDALKQSPVKLVLGTCIDHFNYDADKVMLRDTQSNAYGPFDLLIIAEGAKSKLRAKTRLRQQTVQYPWGALWYISQDKQKQFPGQLFQVVNGAHQMLGFLDTGLDLQNKQPLVSMFWSVRNQDYLQNPEVCFIRLRQYIEQHCPRAHFLLDEINSVDQLTHACYHDVVVKPWHQDKVIIIGDAAHATSPQLGQGVNLGLMDAKVLSACIASHEDLSLALAAYSQRRKKILSYYQFVTRYLTPFFQSNSASLGLMRDIAFPVLRKIPYLNKQMLYTMAGMKTSWI